MASKLQQINNNLQGSNYSVVRILNKHHYLVMYNDCVTQCDFIGRNALKEVEDYLLSTSAYKCEISPQPTEVEQTKEEEYSLVPQYEIFKEGALGGEYVNIHEGEIIYCQTVDKIFIRWYSNSESYKDDILFPYNDGDSAKSEDDLISMIKRLMKEGYTLRQCSNLVYPEALEKAMKPEREEILQYEVYNKRRVEDDTHFDLVANIVYVRKKECYEINWLISGISTKAFSLKKSEQHPHKCGYDQIVVELTTLIKEGYTIEQIQYPLYATALHKATREVHKSLPQYKIMTNPQKQDVKEVLHAATVVYDNDLNLFRVFVEDDSLIICRLINSVTRIGSRPKTYQEVEHLLLNLLRQGFDVEYGGVPKYPNCFAQALEKYEQEQASNQLRDGIMEASKGKQKDDLISDEVKKKVINRIKLEVMRKDDIKYDESLSPSDKKTKMRHMNSKINGMIELAAFIKVVEKGADPNQL
jgi:hypothetical protein